MALLPSRTRLRPTNRSVRHHGLRDHLRERGRLNRENLYFELDTELNQGAWVASETQPPVILVWGRRCACHPGTQVLNSDSIKVDFESANQQPTELESFDFYTVWRLPVANAGQSPTSGKFNLPLILSPGDHRPTVTRMRKENSVWFAASSVRSRRTFARPLPNSRRPSRGFPLGFALPALAAAEPGLSEPAICGTHRKDERGFALRTSASRLTWRSPARSISRSGCLCRAQADPDFHAERRKARDERPTHAFTLIGITHEARDAHQRGPAGRMPDCHC